MENFRAALTAAGFENVQSYIASGNIVLDTEHDTPHIQDTINEILLTQFNISGQRTLLRDALSLERLVKANPFKEAALSRPEKLHVHFLANLPPAQAETNLTSFKGPERLRLDQHHLYIDYINGAGDTALTARFLETALGGSGTARNWNTVVKLHAMAQGQ